MRALPVIVDLFVLLAIFSIVLFYSALGASAPNPASSQLTLIEMKAIVSGPEGIAPASEVMTLTPQLVDENGNPVPGEFGEVALQAPANRRFIVRNAPTGARFRIIVTEITPAAFGRTDLIVDLTRAYPGTETSSRSMKIGQAVTLSVGVAR